jgi:hypothetical protein
VRGISIMYLYIAMALDIRTGSVLCRIYVRASKILATARTRARLAYVHLVLHFEQARQMHLVVSCLVSCVVLLVLIKIIDQMQLVVSCLVSCVVYLSCLPWCVMAVSCLLLVWPVRHWPQPELVLVKTCLTCLCSIILILHFDTNTFTFRLL